MTLVDKIAEQLHLHEPLLFPRPEWETWGSLTDEGKRKYRERAQIAVNVTVEHLGISAGS